MSSIIAVVGAGRGPLIAWAFNAAQNAGRKVEIFAVEKNPHAFIGFILLCNLR
jgi:type II protein arginine methyltransferase